MTPTVLVRLGSTLALLAGILAATPCAAAEDTASIMAVAAATHEASQWLDALDAHRYDESWADAAAVMREGRTEGDWIHDVGTPRDALGKPLMRELKRAEYSTQVRGAPEGKYVTAAYLTQFSKAPPVLETILLTLQDSQWRIAGYSVGLAPQSPIPPPAPEGAAAPEPKAKE
jgi:uncharacterized protein DUF4019